MYIFLLLAVGAPVLRIVTGLQGALLGIIPEDTGVVGYPCRWILILDALLLFGADISRAWPLIIAALPCFPMGLELCTSMMVVNQPIAVPCSKQIEA